MRTAGAIAFLTAASLVLITVLGNDSDRARGSLGSDPEVTLVAIGELEDVGAAELVFDSVVQEKLTDPKALSVEKTRGRVLVIDRSAFSDVSTDLLAQILKSGTPIVALNVPYEDLIDATKFEFVLMELGVSPDSRIVRRPDKFGYYSFVGIFGPDAAGATRTTSGQNELASASQFSANITNLGLLAKGLVIDRRSGGEIRPIEVLSTPRVEINRPPAESPLSSGSTLFIDANGPANGSCNQADSAATVAAGAFAVQLCLAGNTGGNVDGIDLAVTYDDATIAGAPEIDCPASGGGTNCVDDNPDLNDGAATGSQLGTAWSCTAFGTSQPRADTDGAGTGASSARMQCNAAVSSPSALLQNGLLATLTLTGTAATTQMLSFDATSAVSLQGAAGPLACGVDIACTGAQITVQ